MYIHECMQKTYGIRTQSRLSYFTQLFQKNSIEICLVIAALFIYFVLHKYSCGSQVGTGGYVHSDLCQVLEVDNLTQRPGQLVPGQNPLVLKHVYLDRPEHWVDGWCVCHTTVRHFTGRHVAHARGGQSQFIILRHSVTQTLPQTTESLQEMGGEEVGGEEMR